MFGGIDGIVSSLVIISGAAGTTVDFSNLILVQVREFKNFRW